MPSELQTQLNAARLELEQQQAAIAQQAAALAANENAAGDGEGSVGVNGDNIPDDSVFKPEGRWDVKTVLGVGNDSVSIIRVGLLLTQSSMGIGC